MANRQRAEARRKAQAKAARQSGEGGGGGLKWLWIGLGVVVLVVVGIVVFAGGDDDSSATDGTADTSLSSLPDSQPVTVTGDALEDYPSGAAPADDPAVGVMAPVLSGLDFQGDPVVIDAAGEGQAYMVVFLAHWCPHCNDEVPRLLAWKKTGGVPDELKIVGVATAVSSSSANYPPAEWFSNKGWSWPVMVDESLGEGGAGKAAAAYGATGWPYFVIVGADGKVKARYSGEIEIDALQTLVDAALAS